MVQGGAGLEGLARNRFGADGCPNGIRLNCLIEKIEISSQEEADSFIAHVKRMAVDEKIDIGAAAELVDAYRTYSNPGVRMKHEA